MYEDHVFQKECWHRNSEPDLVQLMPNYATISSRVCILRSLPARLELFCNLRLDNSGHRT